MTAKAIVIAGPTAVGKSDLGLQLAHQFDGEIISGDSMQIYRHLDIGTAKIMPAEQQGIPHHLLDICEVDQRYTVYEFQQEAQKLIGEINRRQRVPIVVGGTGFYLNALINNLQLGGVASRDPEFGVRQHFEQLLQTRGAQYLWQLLNQVDPLAAQQINSANTRRVIRALEVVQLTGQKFSQQSQTQPAIDFLVLTLNTKRSVLYQRINQRVDVMLQQGLQKEAEDLYQQRDQVPQAAQGIGYKEWFAYFEQQQSYADTIALIKRNSRRFAKRQLTYFKNQLTSQWYDLIAEPQQQLLIQQVIHHFLEEDYELV
ncbi:tRNA (adenosine(37)-N6)-dimethylallyltransferase MiaA [Bombilactobacillus folatiphilus]|uniref:tRNA dimethylallyltransferase n=1 Tax=Bombilactobacillus folatiphilus TaxID=2923362 RepID=A0ABY4PAM1_9LACO|nr:tRNA (adenosine(37)-N6)-dimethylallyltransferase MiaA [Bombilactobacillus folatiphilus]UQS82566.1 tRNA (adenosine(37)-N6)-dimethylallyltransferase MiaA [Bombilactobacillus folatiphilus]